ncbi:MAG: glucose-1-phosphate cytidylyltransferase [Solirubrobacteraceae bacterium]
MPLGDQAPVPRVVILCGGLGTRMREETEYRPKPMVQVGGRPLLWHIMKLYGQHGFNEFVCALGYRGEVIKRYFLDYHALRSDISISLATGTVQYATREVDDWRVTLVDTGENAMTGARVKRVAHELGDSDVFMCTYGDGVSDLDVSDLLAFHRSHGRLATVTGVLPPSRFGEMVSDGAVVTRFAEKPAGGERISGGFFVFDRTVLERLSSDPACVLEREPLESLVRDGQLCVYAHDGYWQSADTLRDIEHLRRLWEAGSAPWRVWDDRNLSQAGSGATAFRRKRDLLDLMITGPAAA